MYRAPQDRRSGLREGAEGRDIKLYASLALAVGLGVLLLVMPRFLWAPPPVSVAVDPRNVPLNGNFTVSVNAPSEASDVTVHVLQGPQLREIESFHLNGSRGILRLTALEGRYSVGLHVVRVTATLAGRDVTVDEPFTVYYGGNLSVEASVTPEEVNVTLGPNSTNISTAPNVTVVLRVRVLNELGRPVGGARVWPVSGMKRAGLGWFSPDPGKTDADGYAEMNYTVKAFRNWTEEVKLVVGAPGHPIAKSTVSFRVVVHRAQESGGGEGD